MKKFLYFFIVIFSIFLLIYGVLISKASFPKDEIKVLLLYNPSLLKNYGYVLEAYKSVLEEEGVPHDIVKPSFLLSSEVKKIVKSNPVIILPDGVSQILPKDIKYWLAKFLQNGGSIAIIYDAGTKNKNGAFLDESLFSELTGVDYIADKHLGKNSYTSGFLRFKNDKSAEFFQIPEGKLEDLFLAGYIYGKLKYPIARIEIKEKLTEENIYAYTYTEEQEMYPSLILKKYQKGNLLYINLPLGYLKAYSDDLPLRAILRTLLFKVVKIPHLLNTPYGKGGLVVNWHIDDNRDWKYIPLMIKNKLLRNNVECSLHITAGDFVDEPGDGIGFDACGRGKKYVKMLLNYGVIGSHGGMYHNWFAANIKNGALKEKEIEKYIKINSECLESITGYKVVEYSAPVGVYPQPVNTHIIEKQGFLAYYSTGDTGSAPNRSFINGKMISNKVIAFPVMPFGRIASFTEMGIARKTVKEAERFLINTSNYAARNRTVRLLYSHLYDLFDYPEYHAYQNALKAFLDHAETLQQKGKLQIKSMSYFAKFLMRFLKTEYTFTLKGNELEVTAHNPEGLEGMAIAIPKGNYKRPIMEKVIVEEDMDYYYLIIKDRLDEKILYTDTP